MMVRSIALLLSLTACSFGAPVTNGTWPGWKNIKHLFVFGDSYTQTGFNPKSTQPNPSNPMGNPPYPGWTSANGPNWVDFLTYTYNASALYTYNLAYGGATVDAKLVTPYAPTVLSLRDQVQDQFLPIYAPSTSNSASVPWTPSSSLFAFWIGINDVGNSWWLNNATLYDAIFSVLGKQVDDIYAAGGRNFLFLEVPPVNLAPLTLANGPEAVEGEGRVIADWNKRVGVLAAGLESEKEGVKVFVHGTNELYEGIIEEPETFVQTSGLKNTTGFCKAYANGTPTWYTKDDSCTFAVNEYLWLNDLHPTFPIHNATAASVVELLEKN